MRGGRGSSGLLGSAAGTLCNLAMTSVHVSALMHAGAAPAVAAALAAIAACGDDDGAAELLCWTLKLLAKQAARRAVVAAAGSAAALEAALERISDNERAMCQARAALRLLAVPPPSK